MRAWAPSVARQEVDECSGTVSGTGGFSARCRRQYPDKSALATINQVGLMGASSAIRRFLLKTFRGSPVEHIARRWYAAVFQRRARAYDAQTLTLLRRALKADSNCIDVGAYRGDILAEMLRLSPQGEVFAFEPIEENYRFLQGKFPDAHVYNVALSNRAGQRDFFHVTGRPARSGLRKQDYPDPQEQFELVTVTVEVLDALSPPEVTIGLIKIDVEGAELEVLQGAEQLITRDSPIIVFEHLPDLAEKYGTSSDEVYLFLNSCGLGLWTMEGFLEGGQSLDQQAFLGKVWVDHEYYFIAAPLHPVD
jgi:FkbM family methyltransferase